MTAKNTGRNHDVFVSLLIGGSYEEVAGVYELSVQRVKAIFISVRKDLLAYMQTPKGYEPTLATMRRDKDAWFRCLWNFVDGESK